MIRPKSDISDKALAGWLADELNNPYFQAFMQRFRDKATNITTEVINEREKDKLYERGMVAAFSYVVGYAIELTKKYIDTEQDT